MKTKLSSNNLLQYLLKTDILREHEINSIKINSQSSYGSNKLIILFVNLANGQQLLVKQDPHHFNSEKNNIINRECCFQTFCQSLSSLESLIFSNIKIYYFDKLNSILIYKIPKNSIYLKKYYKNNKLFSTVIAKLIGTTLATLHRESVTSLSCHKFMNKMVENKTLYQFSHPSHLLDRPTPETLIKEFPPEGNRFIAFYQSSESLRNKVTELVLSQNYYCLTHNNLELNNILIHQQCEELLSSSESSDKEIIKFINWEKCSWGDPAFDLGTVIASYLLMWAESLIMHPTIELEKSLQLATIPLEVIQPSVVALTYSYIRSFPNVIDEFPDFLNIVVQFTGLALIYKIIEIIQSFEGFDNREICILQLAKSLLVQPEKSFLSIFGMTQIAFNELILLSKVNKKFVVK